MKSLKLLILGLLFSQYSIAQSRTILVFDLVNNTIDSIKSADIDTSIHQAKTQFEVGLFNSNIAILEQDAPSQNTPPGSEITFKEQASKKFELTDYPIRTNVKIFNVVNDTFKNNCSGSLISRRHVLSASHCFSEPSTSSIFVNRLYVCPIYDNGEPNSNIHCSYVSKLYLYKNWNLNGEDFTLLELQDPIGEETGWIGIGYNDDDNFFTADVYHKFSYPAVNDFPFYGDYTAYNGDTLYHTYGKLNSNSYAYLSSQKGTAQRGESGSSITRVINNEDYTSYGVLTYAPFSHNRLTNKTFNDIKSILTEDLIIDPNADKNEYFQVYPNPTINSFRVKKYNSSDPINIEIYNARSELVFKRTSSDLISTLDISCLVNGLYFVRIIGSEKTETVKLLKAY